jgi:tripartite-type tricarboxylate transporter receptor subunit TctC
MKTKLRRRQFLHMAAGAVALPIGTGAAALFGAVRDATAQSYPAGPIRLIVPFPPGGGTDVLSRLLANKISVATGWTFVIDNRPGAGGNIGIDAVAKAKADGQTLGMGQTSNLAINPTLYPKLPYDAARDFAPVMLVASQPNLLVVRKESALQSLRDVVATAKAQGNDKAGGLTMASPGVGTVAHLGGELFAQRAGVKFLHVPYRGAAPAITDVLAGQVDFALATPPAVVSLIRSGNLRALATTSVKRLLAVPDIPTIAEQGFDGFEAYDWKALVAPAGTQPEVIAQLNAAANKALSDPDMIKRLQEEGNEPRGGTPEQLGRYLQAELARWGGIVRASGVKVD